MKILDKRELEDNVVPFERPVPKVDPTDYGVNWLSRIPIGSAFIVQDKRDGNSHFQPGFTIIVRMFGEDGNRSALLLPDGSQSPGWHDTKNFSRRWELVGILGNHMEADKEKETEDGGRSRAIQSDDVEPNEEV